MDSAYAKALAKGFEELRKKLDAGEISEDCQKNVIDKLPKDFSLKSFSNYLSRGATFEDGNLSKRLITSVVSKGNGSPWTSPRTFGPSAQVWRIFDDLTMFYTADKASATKLTVFYQPQAVSLQNEGANNDNYGTIFHEALHGYGSLLGGGVLAKDSPYADDPLGTALLGHKPIGSAEISDHISKYCFK